MQAPKHTRREPPEGFWKTPKGRAIIAARQAREQREVWSRFETWGG